MKEKSVLHIPIMDSHRNILLRTLTEGRLHIYKVRDEKRREDGVG
jgi:hypothetical protein